MYKITIFNPQTEDTLSYESNDEQVDIKLLGTNRCFMMFNIRTNYDSLKGIFPIKPITILLSDSDRVTIEKFS